MEVVASLSQGRTAATQCGLFTHKSIPVIFEPPCISIQQAAENKMFKFYCSSVSCGTTLSKHVRIHFYIKLK